eukprot:g35115.t1
MKLSYALLFLLVLLFVSQNVDAKKKKRKSRTPEIVVDPVLLCDICQATVFNIMVDAKRKPFSKKGGNWDIIVMETLEDHEGCYGRQIIEAAGRLGAKSSEFEAGCKQLMEGGKFLPGLEAKFHAKHVEEATVAQVCIDIGVCKEIWTREQHILKRESLAQRNKREGEEFLKTNKDKEGVFVSPTGLQYQIIDKGNSIQHPGPTTVCTCHYRGTTLDGKEFDSSYSRGEPTQFAPNQVIKGWTEGLQLMSPGDTFKFWIPWNLAYGEQGSGGSIGPYQLLVFDLNLITFEGANATTDSDKQKPQAVPAPPAEHIEL